jgi:hypothetical protein
MGLTYDEAMKIVEFRRNKYPDEEHRLGRRDELTTIVEIPGE